MSQSKDFQAFFTRYQQAFVAAIQSWDAAALEQIARVFADARDRGACILVAGNGGSAAIANHLECDASKGTHHPNCAPLNTRSLASNPSMLLALGNDIGFESVFDRQVEYFARAGDVVMLISSSGNSPNVVNACRAAQNKGLTTVAFVGFKGGKLKELADHTLHVPAENYGIAEDMHQASMHLITQYLHGLFQP